MNQRNGHYISSEEATSLQNFKYNGKDLSLIYKYILSPLAEFIVTLIPRWIAPNIITMFGMTWMIISYMLLYYYCPNFNEGLESEGNNVPRFIFLFNGMAMLIYQTLDNMDGKQARRTGSSSALGLLFDHGLDAFNSMFGSANWLCAMGVKTTEFWQCGVILFCPMGAFYLATWEEYHTHQLILPIINGPTEGLLMGAMLSITTFMYGVSTWHGTMMWDTISQYLPEIISKFIMEDIGPYLFIQENGTSIIRNLDVVCMATILAFAQELLLKSITVVKYTKSISSLKSLLPFMTLAGFSSYTIYYNPNLFIEHPRTCLHLSSLLFTEIVTQLMLDHITNAAYVCYRTVFFPFFMFLICNDDESYSQVLFAYTVGMTVYMSMKVRIVIWEICQILHIWCFDIVTPFPSYEGLSNGDLKKKN